jgi:hypothetical protein
MIVRAPREFRYVARGKDWLGHSRAWRASPSRKSGSPKDVDVRERSPTKIYSLAIGYRFCAALARRTERRTHAAFDRLVDRTAP